MNFIIFGPPGSGKGTQASKLSQRTGNIHISTGEILREAVKNNSPLGVEADKFLKVGKLVPDDVIVAIVEEQLSRLNGTRGFLLDGFPRTVPQAQALDGWLEREHKKLLGILIDLAEPICIARLSKRRTCAKCGRTYNPVTCPPQKENSCDVCNVPLILREDDQAETVQQRLAIYRKLTEPLAEYYRQTGRLVRVDGSLDPEKVSQSLKNLVEY